MKKIPAQKAYLWGLALVVLRQQTTLPFRGCCVQVYPRGSNRFPQLQEPDSLGYRMAPLLLTLQFGPSNFASADLQQLGEADLKC